MQTKNCKGGPKYLCGFSASQMSAVKICKCQQTLHYYQIKFQYIEAFWGGFWGGKSHIVALLSNFGSSPKMVNMEKLQLLELSINPWFSAVDSEKVRRQDFPTWLCLFNEWKKYNDQELVKLLNAEFSLKSHTCLNHKKEPAHFSDSLFSLKI